MNNCSEDIFQSYSEPNEVKLRRSQRILERGLKTPTCFQNVLESFSNQCCSQSLLPQNLANLQKEKNIVSLGQIEDNQINNGDRTPDLTLMLNTEAVCSDSKQITETHKLPHEQCKEYPIGSGDELKKDIKNVQFRTNHYWNASTKTISINNGEEANTPLESPLQAKVLDDKRSSKVQYQNAVEDKNSLETLPSKNSSLSVNGDQGKPSLNTNGSNNESENILKNQKGNSLGLPQSKKSLMKIKKGKSQVLSEGKAGLPPEANQGDKLNLLRGKKKSSNQTTQTSRGSKSRRQPKPTTSRSRKRVQKPNTKKGQQLKPDSTEKSIPKDYVAPKVVRYNNTCPIAQSSSIFQCGFPISEQSLLPTVYPAHFIQQIIPDATVRRAPSACLTPENSQALIQHETVPIVDTPTTPLSVGSLKEFFEVDDLFDILNTEKTIYNLTELHVRALALSLNLNLDNLLIVMDRIVEMDVNFLREKCEQREPVLSAMLIATNQVEGNE